MENKNNFLIFGANVWLNAEPESMRFTQEEIDKADDKGFLGTRGGIDCYLNRPIPIVENKKPYPTYDWGQ